jgi:hypothetical protein
MFLSEGTEAAATMVFLALAGFRRDFVLMATGGNNRN